MDYIRWFDDISKHDIDQVGGKGANLGEMLSANLPVPPGFCLTAQAYRDFINLTGLNSPIQAIVVEMQHDNVEATSAEIRQLINKQQIPSSLAQAIVHGYQRLGREFGQRDIPVAVRSSATAEDLPDASFAGQQDTYLNVLGEGQLLERIKDCWASLWTARAVTYRTKQGFDHLRVYLGVVVQSMIPSDIAGIMFTANPVTGNRDEAVINASWGLGEAIVSGHVTPDTITLNKKDGRVVSEQIANKERMIIYAEDGGVVELDTREDKRQAPSLSSKQLTSLLNLGLGIEKHYGVPQDIEWASYQEKLYILQSRPITTLEAETEERAWDQEYNRTMFIEIFPDALSPNFLSAIIPLFKSMLDFTFRALGFRPPEGIEAAKGFYGQPYFNRNYIEAALEPLSPSTREPFVAAIVNPFGDDGGGSSGELSLPYLRMVLRMLRFITRFPKELPNVIANYQAEVAETAALPLETISDVEIVERIQKMVFSSASNLMNNDFLMIAVIKRSFRLLSAMLDGEDSDEIIARLISGVTGNVTMETNKRIWDLAQMAKASPGVQKMLKEFDEQELRSHLAEIEDGRQFLDQLEQFLAVYGHREVRMDILYPTWGEDPASILSFVRAYLDSDETQSPHYQEARLAREREALTDQVLRDLKQDRRFIAPIFRWLLTQTQEFTRERDTMHFELTRLFPLFRRMLFALGDRWTENGLITKADDVFFLTLDELLNVANSPRPVQDLVQQRRLEFEENQSRPWPDMIRDGQEIYLEQSETVDGEMKGVAGSPGVVTGIARIIAGPEEFKKLGNGEILVAPLTNPVWTPLFAIASGIITEVGGILSHGAIVAREYGIPAVMSMPNATSLISDGEMISVDGSRGIVTFVNGDRE